MNRVIVIIASGHLIEARSLLQQDPFNQTLDQAESTFVPAGSETGDIPPTHHWCSTQMTDESWQVCQQLCEQVAWAACYKYDPYNEAEFPGNVLTSYNLKPIVNII